MNNATRELVRELEPFIRGTVRLSCHAPLPAHLSQEDLVQDACLSVLQAVPRYSGPPQAMRGWVAVIVQRRVAEVYRSTKTWRHYPVGDMTELVDSIDRGHAPTVEPHTESDTTVIELISHLDERSRRILLLRDAHDLSYSEIARRFDITANAVRTAYCRALAKVRAMSEWGIGAPVTLIHRDTIRINPRNQDRPPGELDLLTHSITNRGLCRPLLLRPVPGRGRAVELLDGHRHLAATHRTTRIHVPVVVLTDVNQNWLNQAVHGLPPIRARALLAEHVATGRTSPSWSTEPASGPASRPPAGHGVLDRFPPATRRPRHVS
ncbi:sigma-70 family RNA polymerase sigma factor [Saccharothrix sp. Mg75]|uniref:sigma-70 family RNA polymerase sigma factor n=1 Tax=Saccharothrix sp. Mg75 TaxID=3445357 RepID=UPI003EECA6C0